MAIGLMILISLNKSFEVTSRTDFKIRALEEVALTFFSLLDATLHIIPKVLDPKVVSDYRPISLIGSLYKVVTKILATRLSLVISDLISDVQTVFLPNRQILDGPFIINEILARCKLKKQQAMIFKVDFAKALSSGKASILVNGSPTTEFHFHQGLKQGDPLAPFLFLLIRESLHLSFSWATEAGIFTGFRVDHSITLSHLFYADDAVFIGEWSHSNLKGIMNILRCFSLLSGTFLMTFKMVIERLLGSNGLSPYEGDYEIENNEPHSVENKEFEDRGHEMFGSEAQMAFEKLQKAITEALVLALSYFQEEFIIETNASGYGIGAMLQQNSHPIGF
nr:RNA-directed DNA polymerase, eukaryota [Tanacetum cinerariifolium]